MAEEVKKDKLTEEFFAAIESGTYEKVQAMFAAQKPVQKITPEKSIDQYIVSDHDIFDETLRPKKKVIKDTGERNAAGEPVTATVMVDVARVGVPFQKLIVARRVGFMLSDPVTLSVTYSENGDKEKELVTFLESILDKNKMDFKNKEIARRMMSELEVAEIWYLAENEEPNAKNKFTLKVKIISPELGDSLFPLFDYKDDLIAFARGYKLKEGDKQIEHYDVYTSENEYKYVNREKWNLEETIPNQVKKLMIIYHSQPEPEWSDVQSMIDRFEDIISNHADVNDYFGSPILTIIGELQGYAQKGESGKILQLEQGAQANFLALSSEPASMKMEKEDLEKFIYTMSQTPNITFDEMKGLGQLSGVALRLLFLDAHMAVKTKEETFGIGLQRRINLIKATIGRVIDTTFQSIAEALSIKPVLTPYMPLNDTEILNNLTMGVSGNILSHQTAVENNPFVIDSETEMQRLEEEHQKSLDEQKEQVEEGMKKQNVFNKTEQIRSGRAPKARPFQNR